MMRTVESIGHGEQRVYLEGDFGSMVMSGTTWGSSARIGSHRMPITP